MAAQTGRTTKKFVDVYLSDSGGVLRQLTSINNVGGVGLDYDEVDMTAWNDAIHSVLLDLPTFRTTIGGVFDTTDHGYLIGVTGANTPLSVDFRLGIRQAWQSGEPQFGITKSATDGVLIKNYNVDFSNMTWSAEIVMSAGSAAPAWGTAAET